MIGTVSIRFCVMTVPLLKNPLNFIGMNYCMQFIVLNAFLATERALYLNSIGCIELGPDQTGAVRLAHCILKLALSSVQGFGCKPLLVIYQDISLDWANRNFRRIRDIDKASGENLEKIQEKISKFSQEFALSNSFDAARVQQHSGPFLGGGRPPRARAGSQMAGASRSSPLP